MQCTGNGTVRQESTATAGGSWGSAGRGCTSPPLCIPVHRGGIVCPAPAWQCPGGSWGCTLKLGAPVATTVLTFVCLPLLPSFARAIITLSIKSWACCGHREGAGACVHFHQVFCSHWATVPAGISGDSEFQCTFQCTETTPSLVPLSSPTSAVHLLPGSGRDLGCLLKIIQVQTMGQPSTHSMSGCLALLQGAIQHHWEDLSQLRLPLWRPVLWRTAASHFLPLYPVFHPSSEDHLLLVSNPRLCLEMENKGSPGSLKAFFSLVLTSRLLIRENSLGVHSR